MGLVNTVVPLDGSEQETVQWCREMLELSPLALRLLKGAFNADTDGLAGPAAVRRRRDDALLHDRGGPGGPQRLPGEARRPTSPASREALSVRAWAGPATDQVPPSAHRRWPRPAAHLARSRRGRARCRRRSRRCSSVPRWPRSRGRVPPARLRRGAGRQHLHPDRDQPLQRLLRRAPRRRHRGPARPGARDRRRARGRRARCWSRPGSRSRSRSPSAHT